MTGKKKGGMTSKYRKRNKQEFFELVEEMNKLFEEKNKKFYQSLDIPRQKVSFQLPNNESEAELNRTHWTRLLVFNAQNGSASFLIDGRSIKSGTWEEVKAHVVKWLDE